jgi:hypothetical protein
MDVAHFRDTRRRLASHASRLFELSDWQKSCGRCTIKVA